jgi:ankyrin repeat protein
MDEAKQREARQVEAEFWTAIEQDDLLECRRLVHSNPELVACKRQISRLRPAGCLRLGPMSETSESPLSYAVKHEQTALVHLLLQLKFPPTTSHFTTDVHIAAEIGNLEIFDLLLTFGANPFILDEPTRHLVLKSTFEPDLTPQCSCCRRCQELEPSSLDDEKIEKRVHSEYLSLNPILYCAVKGSNLSIVSKLLDSNPSAIKNEDSHGRTPLHAACFIDNEQVCLSIIDFLLVRGADVNAKTSLPHPLVPLRDYEVFGATPLQFYLLLRGKHARLDIVKRFIERGARVASTWTSKVNLEIYYYLATARPHVFPWTPFHSLAFEGRVDAFESMFKVGSHPPLHNAGRFGSCVHIACARQHVTLVQCFFAHIRLLTADALMFELALDSSLVTLLLSVASQRLDKGTKDDLIFKNILHALKQQTKEANLKALQLLSFLPPNLLSQRDLVVFVFSAYENTCSDSMLTRLKMCRLLIEKVPDVIRNLATDLVAHVECPEALQMLLDLGANINEAIDLCDNIPLTDRLVKNVATYALPYEFEFLLLFLARDDVHFNLRALQDTVSGSACLREPKAGDEMALEMHFRHKRYFPIFAKLIASKTLCCICLEFCAMAGSSRCDHVLLCLTCRTKLSSCPECLTPF